MAPSSWQVSHLPVPENNVSDALGDFKKFTGKKITKAITEHPGESRKEWMLKILTR